MRTCVGGVFRARVFVRGAGVHSSGSRALRPGRPPPLMSSGIGLGADPSPLTSLRGSPCPEGWWTSGSADFPVGAPRRSPPGGAWRRAQRSEGGAIGHRADGGGHERSTVPGPAGLAVRQACAGGVLRLGVLVRGAGVHRSGSRALGPVRPPPLMSSGIGLEADPSSFTSLRGSPWPEGWRASRCAACPVDGPIAAIERSTVPGPAGLAAMRQTCLRTASRAKVVVLIIGALRAPSVRLGRRDRVPGGGVFTPVQAR